jgi:hypothetical protein
MDFYVYCGASRLLLGALTTGRYLLFFSPHISFCDLYPILRIAIFFAAPPTTMSQKSLAYTLLICNSDSGKSSQYFSDRAHFGKYLIVFFL